MTFSQVPLGSSLFLDANTFVYHFTPHPTWGVLCAALLRQVQRRQIAGFTSTNVLTEVAHRLMTFEAASRFGWPHSKVAQRLRGAPVEIQKLTTFRQAIDEVPNLGVQVLTIAPNLVSAAAAVSQQAGLLTNDALIVAVMQAHGLSHLASHDADFDRVAGSQRFGPV